MHRGGLVVPVAVVDTLIIIMAVLVVIAPGDRMAFVSFPMVLLVQLVRAHQVVVAVRRVLAVVLMVVMVAVLVQVVMAILVVLVLAVTVPAVSMFMKMAAFSHLIQQGTELEVMSVDLAMAAAVAAAVRNLSIIMLVVAAAAVAAVPVALVDPVAMVVALLSACLLRQSIAC